MSHLGDGWPRDVGREAAIQRYQPLIKYAVGRLAPKLPVTMDREDLLSYGLIGLLDAFARFDAGRGVKFETYAITRIRGAIIDALRSQDRLSRTSRQNARRIEQVLCGLTNGLGRLPTRAEMAAALDVRLNDYDAMLREASWATISLDLEFEADDGEAARSVVPPDHTVADFSAGLILHETRSALSRAVAALPERELLIVSLYYDEGLTMKEIAGLLDVSPTRICQLHTRAIARLRERMAQEDAA